MNEKKEKGDEPDRAILLQEIQVFLAQKRTSLSEMRTGIMILTLPMSVFTVLVATSDFYNIFAVLPLFTTLVAVSIALLVFAMYLVMRAIKKIFFVEGKISELRNRYPFIKRTFRTERFIDMSMGKKKKKRQ
jgi:hypothetical protein